MRQHNTRYETHAGQIVKESGQEWELQSQIEVEDIYWAESVFWGATGLADIPYLYGVEVQRMSWTLVQAGLEAAKAAGSRPPAKVPDHVYALATWMKRRLRGRGIALDGHIRSKYGKANFVCRSGHIWRTTPVHVAEGQGCPHCGVGTADPEDVRRAIGAGTLVLLVHPEQPGLIRLGLTQSSLHEGDGERWEGWEVHRYRSVEDCSLAEALFWETLGIPVPDSRDGVEIDLKRAEQAIRELIPRMEEVFALIGRSQVEVPTP